MTFNDIETALGQRLLAVAGSTPIAWPNKDFDPVGNVPYIEFRHAPNTVDDPVISGGYGYQLGLALITVVTERGQFSTEANTLAETIRAGFPKALRLAAGGGNVVINAPTSPGTPFVDGVYWRQPLTVSYITEPA